jgi:hypothetical protein
VAVFLYLLWSGIASGRTVLRSSSLKIGDQERRSSPGNSG